MSLGSFTVGTTVRIPLQVLENGGIPATGVSGVAISEMVKPDLSKDSDFPKNMTLLSSDYSVYYLDYTPEDTGNYIAIITLTIGSTTYSQIESFHIASVQSASGQIPTAKPA